MSEFDDLIPASTPATTGVFDDLVPQTPNRTASSYADEASEYGGEATAADTTSAAQKVGQIVNYPGHLIRAGLADAASYPFIAPGESSISNLRAASDLGNKTLPIDATMDAQSTPPLVRGAYKVAGSMEESIPKLAALEATGPSLLAQSIAAGGLFGIDEDGNFNPKQAVIGALMPGMSKLASRTAGIAIANGIAAGSTVLKNPTAQKTIEALASQAALNAYQLAANSPELIKQYQDDPEGFKSSILTTVGQNLAFGLFGAASEFKPGVASKTQDFLSDMAQKASDKAAKDFNFNNRPLPTVEASEPPTQAQGKPAPTDNIKDAEIVPPESATSNLKKEPNAIQIRSATPVSVEPTTGSGQEVGGRVPQPEETPLPQKGQTEISNAPQVAQPNPITPESVPAIRAKLEENLGGRNVVLTPQEFNDPNNAHLNLVLGKGAPTWQQLIDSKVLIGTPQPNGSVEIKVAPLNSGGAQENLPPAAQAISKANNSREAFLKANGGVLPTASNETQPQVPVQAAANPQFEVVSNPPARNIGVIPNRTVTITPESARIQEINGELVSINQRVRQIVQENRAEQEKAQGEGREITPGYENKELRELDKREKLLRAEVSPLIEKENAAKRSSKGASAPSPEILLAVQKYRIGTSPQTYTLLKRLPQSPIEKETREQPVSVKNDKTGKVETVLESDLTPVKTRTAEEKAAVGKRDYDAELRANKLDPSVFQNDAQKREALKRFRKGELGDGEGPYIEETQATGREAIRQMFDRMDIGIDQKTRDVWQAMLNVPALRDLDWQNLAVKMRQSIEGGLAGAQSPGQIELSSRATAQTFPHEVFHILYDALPQEYRDAVNQMRVEELHSRFGNNIPEAFRSGTMSTDDFLRLGFPKELYPLINPSEYLANIAGKKFAEEDFKKFSNQPEGFWSKFHAQLQKWIKAIANTFKRIVRARPDLNSIIDDLLNGRWKTTPETGAEYERRGSLAVSKENYFKQEAFKERALPERTLAAYGDLSTIKNREADAIDASPEARKLVSIPNQDLLASMASTSLAVNRFVLDNYAKMKARVAGSDPGLKWSVTQDALHALENEKVRMARTAGLLEKQEAKVKSTAFIKSVQSMIDRGDKAIDTQEALDTYKSQMAQSAADIIKELDAKGKTEAQYEQLRSDYQRLQKMQEFSSIVAERVNDIVNTVAAGKDGLDLLYGGMDKTGDKIYKAYVDLKEQSPNAKPAGLRSQVDPEFLSAADRALLSESRNPKLTNDQKIFTRLASQVLAANTGLRWEMASKAHAMIDPAFKASMSAVGDKFRKQFEKDPELAIRQIIKAFIGLTQRAVNAETAWLRMQRKIMPELRRYDTLKQAVEIDTRTANSPEYKALVNEIQKDAGAVTIPSSELSKATPGNVFNEYSGRQKLRAPSGIEYDINLGYTSKTVQAAQEQMNLYLSDMNAWLNDPANAQSPDRPYWQMRSEFIENAVNVSNVLSPTSIASFGAKGAWTMMDFFFKGSSLPAAKLAWTAGNNFFRSYNVADQWYNGAEGEWRTRVINAIKSHGYDANTESARYQQEVLNRLAAEYRNGNALVAGQKLNNGIVLTAQDIDLLKYQGRSINILFNGNRSLGREGVMSRDLVLDQWNKNVFALRSAQELGAVSGTTLPHEFSQQAAALARQVAQLNPGDVNGLISLFDRPEIFDEFVKRFFAERKSDFSTLSPFEDIYRDMAEKWRDGAPDAPMNMGEVVAFINGRTTAEHTQDSIRKEVVGEMESQLRNFNKKYVERESEGSDVRAIRATKESSFTKGFQRDVGSSFFYDYGAMTSPEVRSIAVDSTNFHLVRLVNALDSAMKSYDEALAQIGTTKDVKTMTKQQQKAFRSGEDFRNFERLQSERSQLKYFRDRIGEAYGSNQQNVVDLFSNLGGLTRDFTGMALTGLNTIGKVAVGSTMKSGLILAAFERNGIASYPKNAWSTLMSAASIFGRGIKNVPGETYKAWKEGGKEGVGFAVARGMQEAFESLFRQGKYFNQQYEYGLGFKNPVGFRVYNEVTTPYSGGMGYDAKLANNFLARWSQQAFYRLWSTGLRPPLEVVKAMFPQLAYAISYDAVARAGSWTVDGIAAQARRSFEYLEKSGKLSNYDLDNPSLLKNILPVDYILPTGIFEKTQTNLNFARDWWQRAVDLPINEMVINYWKRLSVTPPDQRGSVSFLAADKVGAENIKNAEDGRMGALLSILLKDVHHASPENRPMILRVDRTQRFLFPLLGWTTQSIRDTAYRMGAAPSPNMGRMRLLAAAGALGFIAAATLAGEAEKELKKVFAGFMGEEYPVKMLSESQNGKEASKMLALDATSMIPVVHDMLASFMGENGVHSAGTGITVFSVDRLNAMLHYVTGAIKTGDWSYGLATLANQELPFAKFFTSKMESRKGLLTRQSVQTMVEKYGPDELKNKTIGGYAVPNELSPFKQRLSNAIFSGDKPATQKAMDEFVAQAIVMGKSPDEARKILAQTVVSLNPIQVGSSKMTQSQRQEFLAKLNPSQLQIEQAAESNYQDAENLVGRTTDLTKLIPGGSAESSGRIRGSGFSSGGSSGSASVGSGTSRIRSSGSNRIRGRGRAYSIGGGIRGIRAPHLRSVSNRVRSKGRNRIRSHHKKSYA
jgi:hypothetical protein